MTKLPVDLDRLATHLRDRMKNEKLTLRTAAPKIGISPATLGRLLQGSASPNVPDTAILVRVTEWLGRSMAEFETNRPASPSTLADVEVHLRALPNLTKRDAEAIVAMVRAAYDSAASLSQKKSPRR